jgi:hypothetical protein
MSCPAAAGHYQSSRQDSLSMKRWRAWVRPWVSSRRMAMGGHGLFKISVGPTMPDPSSPCRRTIPETALRAFQGWPACRAGSLWPSSTLLDTTHRTPMHKFLYFPNITSHRPLVPSRDSQLLPTQTGKWKLIFPFKPEAFPGFSPHPPQPPNPFQDSAASEVQSQGFLLLRDSS